MKIEGSVALVTGANRGIGRALAEALLDRGAAKVYAAVRDVASVTDPRLVPVQLDVTDPDQVQTVAEQLGDVQIVVNNAGIGRPSTPLTATLDDARAELEVNYLSLISTTQAFAPVLAANGGGAFVNVLSVASWVGVPTLPTYAASKSAAWGFTNAARVQLKRPGHPGRRRACRLRRHRSHGGARHRQDPAGRGGHGRARRTRSRRAGSGGRRVQPNREGRAARRPAADLPGHRGGVPPRHDDRRLRLPGRGPGRGDHVGEHRVQPFEVVHGHPEAFDDGRRDPLRLGTQRPTAPGQRDGQAALVVGRSSPLDVADPLESLEQR